MSAPIVPAVFDALRASQSVRDWLDDRLFDRVPERARVPYLTFGALRSVPLDAEGAERHELTLDLWSRGRGRTQATNALAAVRAALDGADLAIQDHRCVDCRVTASESGAEGLELHRAALRLRIVTEPNE